MERIMNRRAFSRGAGVGLGALWLMGSPVSAAPARRLKLGHTRIAWGLGPENAEQAIKDVASLSVIRHIHLKDFDGGPRWEGSCPLGQGKVDIPAILGALEKARDLRIAMVELDPSPNPPMTPLETARASREYVKKLGYAFRA